ncbi:hypothetical protein VE25_07050 [Devosia geojensis]|uniref:Beta/gamma crystallin 'Greek key' domain-containing protein n=1 Tax=Devosia geojensis TaxID=443610 RepID=A0A0F5FUH2_9HYPH|nr:hypothetical protein [Devosia geojensis]KKB12483.1 hypothetical protein VE25_07050 [Devosia geojensis]
MKNTVLAALAAAAVASTATAAEYTFQIEKPSNVNIRSIRVEGGEVIGLPEGREPDTFSVTVRLPDGVCRADLTLFYNNTADMRSDSSVDFCRTGGIKVRQVRY